MKGEDERRKMIEAFFDGEASPEEAEQVEEWLRSCEVSQQIFAELSEIRHAMATAIESEVAKADFGALWKRIEGDLNQPAEERGSMAEPAVEKDRGLWSRLAEMFKGQPLIPAGAMALLVMAVVVGSEQEIPVDEGGLSPGTGIVASADLDSDKREETSVSEREEQSHLAYVSGVEYGAGTVFLDQDTEDPTQPLIVWHIEGDGEDASQGG